MLSYRHAFHAGNFADVLKHIVVIEILEHLIKKAQPFDYIDTHGGAGLYDLRSAQASKLQEYTQGISKLRPAEWPELSRLFAILDSFNPPGNLMHYPGSPMIALQFLREKDRAWLFELHPADFAVLQDNTHDDKRVKAIQKDGFKGLLALLPPLSRRGLILIDPPYEMKTDYDLVLETVSKAHKIFATGTYAIWYPVVDRKRIERLMRKFTESGIKKIQRFELGIAGDCRDAGMTAAGMLVINPPWPLYEKMTQLLPKLVSTLAKSPEAYHKCDVLVGE